MQQLNNLHLLAHSFLELFFFIYLIYQGLSLYLPYFFVKELQLLYYGLPGACT